MTGLKAQQCFGDLGASGGFADGEMALAKSKAERTASPKGLLTIYEECHYCSCQKGNRDAYFSLKWLYGAVVRLKYDTTEQLLGLCLSSV